MNKLIERMKGSIEFAEKEGENMDDEDILISYNEAKELIRLYEWKQSAINLLNDLDLQEIGKEMKLTPGQDIATKILPFIKDLKSKVVVQN